MLEKIIDNIPSKTLREYLYKNNLNLSILQQATVVVEFIRGKDRIILLKELETMTTNENEKLLINSAIKDIKKYGFVKENTNKIYRDKFPQPNIIPLYPFLEICNLPILFKKGDIVSCRDKLYYVERPSQLTKNSDFTDECYYCYLINSKIKAINKKEDLIYIHDHIHICDAERVDINTLTDEQKFIIEKINQLKIEK